MSAGLRFSSRSESCSVPHESGKPVSTTVKPPPGPSSTMNQFVNASVTWWMRSATFFVSAMQRRVPASVVVQPGKQDLGVAVVATLHAQRDVTAAEPVELPVAGQHRLDAGVAQLVT